MTTAGRGPGFGRGPVSPEGASALVRFAVLALFLFLLAPSTAFAHAERVSSTPKESARVQRVPAKLAISFSEPPTGDSNLEVLDGCGNDVVDEILVQNMDVSATLQRGQPGNWEVRSSVVSGVDGHQTDDTWSFRVAGPKDCSKAPSDGGGDRPRAGGDDDDDESSFPVVPIAIGVAALLVVAIGLRVLTGRSKG